MARLIMVRNLWHRVFLLLFFFKIILGGHIHMSYFGATDTPVLDFWWYLLWVSKARVGCLICIAEANVMYVPWDPPLVLHIADLLMVSIVGHWPGSCLSQGYYWHQWGSNPQSRDHEFYALTTWPSVPVICYPYCSAINSSKIIFSLYNLI